MLHNLINRYLVLFTLIYRGNVDSATTNKVELECEFPPNIEEDLTHIRRKRLTTETGLVCLEDYPYTVSIRLNGKHWCGGALVGKEWVLSAAQCFDYVTKEEVSVRVGSVFRDFGGKILAAQDIRRHPEYKMDMYYPEHNLAMLKLNIPIKFTNRIQAVQLAGSNAELPPRFGEVVVTGYGSIFGQILEGHDQELRRMIVQEVHRGTCRELYGNDYRLQRDHFCLQSVNEGVALCAGDTGDPAVHFSGSNRGGTLYGIALFSGTEECALKSRPGIYAKIRAKVMGYVASVGWTMASAQLATFAPITAALGMYTNFYWYAAVHLIGAAAVLALLPETRGKSIEQIENELRNK